MVITFPLDALSAASWRDVTWSDSPRISRVCHALPFLGKVRGSIPCPGDPSFSPFFFFFFFFALPV